MPVTLLILKPTLAVLLVDSLTAIKRKSTSGERTFRGIADCGIASSYSSACNEMRIGLFTTRVECAARVLGLCVSCAGGGASHAARPSAFQHASGLPRAPAPPRNPHGIICFCATVFVVRRRRLVFCSRSSRFSSFHLLLGYHRHVQFPPKQ